MFRTHIQQLYALGTTLTRTHLVDVTLAARHLPCQMPSMKAWPTFPIIMGVALDVHVSQARWQQLKNMSALIAIGSMISFPKVYNATFSAATKTS